MNKFYQFIFLLFFSAPAFLYAGTTGKISGNVKDKRTNEPLTGATVVVDGTRLGGTTDAKGDYYILNVPPGTYSVTATFIGYARTTVTQVRIKIDQTTQVNLSMTETSFQTQDVAVVAERPKVEIDLTASKENISKEELSNTWGQGIADVVSDLTAANVNGGIRGSFGLDMSYRVEGMDLRDPGSNTNFSSVNLTAIQEVEVLTGGWNAEYGQANGSIVNIVTRKATDRIHAVASYRMRPSGKYHWGRNLYGDDDPMYNVMTTADFWDPSKTWKTPWMETPLAGYNGGIAPFTNMTPQQRADWWTKFVNDRNQFPWIDYTERTQWEQEVTVYGPVTKGLSFMLSGRYKEGVEIYPSALKYNPDMTFQGSIDWNMLDNTKVSLSGVFTKFTNSGSPRTNYQSSETNPSEIAVQQMAYIMDPYSDYKFWLSGTKGGSDTFTMRPPEKADLSSLQAKITHVFSNETFMEVALQQSKMNYSLDYRDIARAAYYPSFGLPLSELPDTTYKLPGYGIAPPNSWYTPRWGYAGDVWRTWTVSSSYGIKADLTSQVTKHHLLKTGLVFSYQMFEKHSHEGGLNPGNTFAQVNDIVPITDHPYEGALYVQDKIEVGNMVVNAGIRFDFFNANKNVSADIYDPLMLSALTPGNSGQIGRVGYRQDGSGPGYVKTTAKYAFSPRIGISHPITETTVLHFMFGMFNQRPSWNKLLANPVVWTSRFANNLNSDFFIPDTTLVTYRYYGQKVGNPALTWEKMIQYEIGFEQNIANVLSLDVTMYYKDGWDLTSLGMDQG
ncbi:MAG: carboxypeptidase regulatory-like domain-containing protein, partial [Syntrophothermus sp.]